MGLRGDSPFEAIAARLPQPTPHRGNLGEVEANPYAPPETDDLAAPELGDDEHPELDTQRARGLAAELRVRLAGVFAVTLGFSLVALAGLAAMDVQGALGSFARRGGAVATGLALVGGLCAIAGAQLATLRPAGRHPLALAALLALGSAAALRPTDVALMVGLAALPLVASAIIGYRSTGPLSPYYREVVVPGSHARPLLSLRGFAGVVLAMALAWAVSLILYAALLD